MRRERNEKKRVMVWQNLGSWRLEFCHVTADKSPLFPLCSEPELWLKSVWLFVFIALTNLFI